MKKELIISHEDDRTKIALLEDGRLFELHEEEDQNEFVVGDLFLGKVKKLAPNLNAAFVNIGYEKDAFLHYQDLGPDFLSYQKFQKILIDKYEYEGSIQLHLFPGDGVKKEKVVLKVEDLFKSKEDAASLESVIFENYPDLKMVVKEDLVLEFEVEIVERKDLTFSPSTGKLRSVIDHRI
jgi:Ribonuclease G/E